jgi:DNA-binding transcriptional regulator of glucitol operon
VHASVLVLVAAFLALGRWQFGRAADGNLLSYGYAIQWPAFAVFAVWVWIAEMRKALRSSAASNVDLGLRVVDEDQTTTPSPRSTAEKRRPRSQAAYDDSDDPQLAAYNHYLSWLNAHPHATPADYPGPPASKELSS